MPRPWLTELGKQVPFIRQGRLRVRGWRGTRSLSGDMLSPRGQMVGGKKTSSSLGMSSRMWDISTLDVSGSGKHQRNSLSHLSIDLHMASPVWWSQGSVTPCWLLASIRAHGPRIVGKMLAGFF